MSTAARGRDVFAKYKRLIGLLTRLYKILPVKSRRKAFEKHRFSRRKLGIGLRYAILKSFNGSVGDNVAIYTGVYLLHPENAVIGNNVSVQPMCYLECGSVKGGITIGNDVSIAHGVTVMATSHTFDDPDTPIKDQNVTCDPVRIDDNVWIGAKTSILSGVTVAGGCVVGAGAVVTKSTEPNGVYVGVPARRIKDR